MGLRAPTEGAIVPTPIQVHRWVSVGLLVVLRVGDLWRNGFLVGRAEDEAETFRNLRVEAGKTSILKAGSSSSTGGLFLLPLAQHPWHLAEGTHSYCVSVDLGEGRSLVVPCLELVRFYFGSSGSLLHRLFEPGLERSSLYTVARRDRSGALYLELAPGVSRASAADVGRLALSPDAWGSAALVSRSCVRASVQQAPIFPMARFPFHGETDLAVRGKWIGHADGSRTFVVFSIDACTYPFPFESLFARAVPAPGDDDRIAAGSASLDGNRRGPERTDVVDRDASTQIPRAEVWVRTGRNFRDLDHKRVVSGYRLATKSKDARGGGDRMTEHSVGEPGGSGLVHSLGVEEGDQRKPLDYLPVSMAAVLRMLESMPEIVSTVLTGSLATADEQTVADELEGRQRRLAGVELDGWTSSLRELLGGTGSEEISEAALERRVLGLRLDRNAWGAVLTVVEARAPSYSLVPIDGDDVDRPIETVTLEARRLVAHPRADEDTESMQGDAPLDAEAFKLHIGSWFEARIRIDAH